VLQRTGPFTGILYINIKEAKFLPSWFSSAILNIIGLPPITTSLTLIFRPKPTSSSVSHDQERDCFSFAKQTAQLGPPSEDWSSRSRRHASMQPWFIEQKQNIPSNLYLYHRFFQSQLFSTFTVFLYAHFAFFDRCFYQSRLFYFLQFSYSFDFLWFSWADSVLAIFFLSPIILSIFYFYYTVFKK
jgi:hypothetical protein